MYNVWNGERRDRRSESVTYGDSVEYLVNDLKNTSTNYKLQKYYEKEKKTHKKSLSTKPEREMRVN